MDPAPPFTGRPASPPASPSGAPLATASAGAGSDFSPADRYVLACETWLTPAGWRALAADLRRAAHCWPLGSERRTKLLDRAEDCARRAAGMVAA